MTPDGTETASREPPPAGAQESAVRPAGARLAPPPPPVVVPRWVQLVLLPIALLALYALARAAGVVLLVFLAAAVIALLLNPLVSLVERSRLPRGLCVAAVYLSFVAVTGVVVVLLINPVSNQIQSFQRDVPSLVRSANHSLANLQDSLDRHHINVHIKDQGKTALQTLQRSLTKRSGDIVAFSRDVAQRMVEGAFALVLVLVISVYMLLYASAIGRLVRRVMPPGSGVPEDDYPVLAQRAVLSFVRGQVLFSLIMGVTAGVALWMLGVIGVFPDGRTYALFFGVWYGLMEAVPYLGPVLGAAAPILVALFQDPLTAVWVLLVCIVIQQIEGHVVAPLVFGRSLRINPLLVIFALLFGGETFGIIGALLALPLAAMARETVVYLRRHLVLEPWATASALDGVGTLPAAPPCPGCGAGAAPGDAYCRQCGGELVPGARELAAPPDPG